MCNSFWLNFVFWVAAVPGGFWLTALLYAHLKICLMDEPCCCHPFMSPLSSIHFSWCPLFPSSSAPSYYSIFPLPSPLFSPFSLFPPYTPYLFILLLSTFLPSLSIPTVALLNKCISHVVELIHGSFSSVPYGPTVKLHKVFKVLALKQISVYSTGPDILIPHIQRLWHSEGGY